jgi:hypothetical protein
MAAGYRLLNQRCPRGYTRIRIRYYAVPNTNKHRGGFCPVIQVNRGHEEGHTYCSGYDLDHARALAQAEAKDEARRYGGDYCVTVVGSVRARQIGRRRR